MKQLIINGTTWFYKTICDVGEYGDTYETNFWKEEKDVTFRKYWLWGPWITKKKPVILFTIYADSNDPSLTKAWWRREIEREVELLGRKAELNKGELI